MRMRLLPSTIAMASLLLVSKTVGLGLAYLPGDWSLRVLVVPVAEAAAATDKGHAPADAAQADASHAARQQAESPQSATPVSMPKPAKPSDPPAPVISPEERQLLQDLQARRREWDNRDRAMTQREGVLSAAEQRLVARAAELADLQARLEQMEKSRAERDDANWIGLVKVYEVMKPREAAAIFNDMDMPVLLQVVDRMKEAKAALILGAMQPDRARLVTSQLAAKRSRATTVPDHIAATPTESSSHS